MKLFNVKFNTAGGTVQVAVVAQCWVDAWPEAVKLAKQRGSGAVEFVGIDSVHVDSVPDLANLDELRSACLIAVDDPTEANLDQVRAVLGVSR